MKPSMIARLSCRSATGARAGYPRCLWKFQPMAFFTAIIPSASCQMGTPEGIARFTVERAREFHARWYRLSNVWFIVTRAS